MGAWIAAIVGERHPRRVERLVLIDGGLPIPYPEGADADSVVEAIVGPALARLAIEFASRDEFFDGWRSHPALAAHWDDAMKRCLDFELVPSDGGYRVRVNPEAVTVGAREITVDPATNAAGARVTVPTHVLVVERGTADQEGGMIPLPTVESVVSTNQWVTMEYLAGLNHYTLVLGEGAPLVAAAIRGS
jgi:pimeloyl-ACP methyl ester carboxylesterase